MSVIVWGMPKSLSTLKSTCWLRCFHQVHIYTQSSSNLQISCLQHPWGPLHTILRQQKLSNMVTFPSYTTPCKTSYMYIGPSFAWISSVDRLLGIPRTTMLTYRPVILRSTYSGILQLKPHRGWALNRNTRRIQK